MISDSAKVRFKIGVMVRVHMIRDGAKVRCSL